MPHTIIHRLPLRVYRCLGSATLATTLSFGFIGAASGNSVDPPGGDRASAQSRFEQAVQAYRDQRFQEAIDLFLAADRLAPRPALAFNVARAYEKLHEPARALQYYRDYLRRGPDAANVEEVKTRVRELEAELAKRGEQQITVRSEPPGAVLSIDGAPRGTTPWTGELPIGTHHVDVEHEQYQSRRVSVTLDGEALELALALPPAYGHGDHAAAGRFPVTGSVNTPPVDSRRDLESDGLHPWPWVAVGTGGAALVAAGVFELLRRDAESDAQSARYQTDYYADRDRMTSHQTTARVLLGVGTVLALSGGVLALIDSAAADTERTPVALGCDATTCLGTWMGNF